MTPMPRPTYAPHTPLLPAEAAGLLRVHPKTVVRHGHEGKIPMITTLGGHHRFYYAAIVAVLLGQDPWDACADVGLPTPPRPTGPTP